MDAYYRSDMQWLKLQNHEQHSTGSRSDNPNTQNEDLSCIGKVGSMKHLCPISQKTNYVVYDISQQDF